MELEDINLIRDNIIINEAREVRKNQTLELLDLLLRFKIHDYPCVIICSTKKEVNNIADYLSKSKFRIAKYHSDMSIEDQDTAIKNFLEDRINIFITTGCYRLAAKANIRFLIHNNMPLTFDRYIENLSLMGKDGNLSISYMFWCEEDINLAEYILKKNRANLKPLYAMIEFCREYSSLAPEAFVQQYCEGGWKPSHDIWDYKAKRRYIPAAPRRVHNDTISVSSSLVEEDEEESRKEYIREKMFGGLGSIDDETQTWHQVAACLDDNTPYCSSNFCTGLSSDMDDCVREAYTYLSNDY